MKKSGRCHLNRTINLLPTREKTVTLCPHGIAYMLPRVFSLNQSMWEKFRQSEIKRHLAEIAWILQKCLCQERQKTGECHVMVKAEARVMLLHPKPCQRSPAKLQKEARGTERVLPHSLRGTNPADISGFQPPQLRDNKFLLFKPLSLWHFVTAATVHPYAPKWLLTWCTELTGEQILEEDCPCHLLTLQT